MSFERLAIGTAREASFSNSTSPVSESMSTALRAHTPPGGARRERRCSDLCRNDLVVCWRRDGLPEAAEALVA